ncbi:MAG: hypothetical protein J6N70_05870, partial [Oribacterium sp.]|nr:hypothetical protein [Oribacterium sp.]
MRESQIKKLLEIYDPQNKLALDRVYSKNDRIIFRNPEEKLGWLVLTLEGTNRARVTQSDHKGFIFAWDDCFVTDKSITFISIERKADDGGFVNFRDTELMRIGGCGANERSSVIEKLER